MPLHGSIEIVSRRLKQGGIVVNVVPKLALFLVRPLPPSDDDAALGSGIQVIDAVRGVPYVICIREMIQVIDAVRGVPYVICIRDTYSVDMARTGRLEL